MGIDRLTMVAEIRGLLLSHWLPIANARCVLTGTKREVAVQLSQVRV